MFGGTAHEDTAGHFQGVRASSEKIIRARIYRMSLTASTRKKSECAFRELGYAMLITHYMLV